MSILKAENLSVRYGGVKALTDVTIEVGEGQLVGLIGPNGAGKTTFIDALTGFTSCSGTVTLAGASLTNAKPQQRARLGLGRTWQGAELYDDLTVRENLQVGAYRPSWRRTLTEVFTGKTSHNDAVEKALDLLDLRQFADQLPGSLTQGQRKSVDVARSIAGEPRVVCLDEPAAGLDSEESLELGERLRRLVKQGTSMLLVDHDMGLVLGVCDRIYVLNLGAMLFAGTPDEIRKSPEVVEAYLGEEETDDSADAEIAATIPPTQEVPS